MPDRLLIDLNSHGDAKLISSPASGLPELVDKVSLVWPLNAAALEDLRWYLEDYLLAPFGVWEARGPRVQEKLPQWGEQIFESLFRTEKARIAYEHARDSGLQVVIRSATPSLLGLPWELMRDGKGPVALTHGGLSRGLKTTDHPQALEASGGQLRALMVISRPEGTSDLGYQMIARPLLDRLEAVRGEVRLTVLRPPTFETLRETVKQAADTGQPFHIVHFDGHGAMPHPPAAEWMAANNPLIMDSPIEGVLAFENLNGGSEYVRASQVAAVLAEGQVPVAVLNACQSGAVGKELDASVATALLQAGCAAVVAMAYSIYAVAAAEFMAAFYETLFSGASVGQAVTAGRRQLFGNDRRLSLKGNISLADWVVPVHYMRKEVSFPQAKRSRTAEALSLNRALDQIRIAPSKLTSVPDSLDPANSAFIGRDDLLYQLDITARLRQTMVIIGPGGTGKTELAKGFARWWRDTGGVDDSRLIFWHSFEPGTANYGLNGVVSNIGLAEFGKDFALLKESDRITRVKDLLAKFRALLVWDNFESVHEMADPTGISPPLDEQSRIQLLDFLTWIRDQSRSVVLITSRAPGHWLGEVSRIMVGGLNRHEAAGFADHLLAPYPAAQIRRGHRSFGDLLAWLDGHPLAMRLVLPRLDTDEPSILLDSLQGSIPLSDENGLNADRSTSLPASITYSYTHLPERSRRLLPIVSLLHGTVADFLLKVFSSIDGVPTRFANVSGQEWAAALDDATRVGLLTKPASHHYQIHPALPAYLANAWSDEESLNYRQQREACKLALCATYASFSSALIQQLETGNASIAYSNIRLHRRTLGVMLEFALDHMLWEEAAHIITALDHDSLTRGLNQEVAGWNDRILRITTEASLNPQSAAANLHLYALGQQANLQEASRQLDQAAQTRLQILTYLQRQPESAWRQSNIAGIYFGLGKLEFFRGRLAEAEKLLYKTVAISKGFEDKAGLIAFTFSMFGDIAQMRGLFDEADSWYRRALAAHKGSGNQLARIQLALSRNELHQGELDKAQDLARRALAASEAIDDKPGMAAAYDMLGLTTRHRGIRAGRRDAQVNDAFTLFDEAEEWYREALTISEEIGEDQRLAEVYHQVGLLKHSRGALNEAEEWYRKALAVSEKLGDDPGLAATFYQLGRAASDRGVYNEDEDGLHEAEDWYRKALAINEKLGDLRHLRIIQLYLGFVTKQCGRLDEAEIWTREALAINEKFDDLSGLAEIYSQLGSIAHDRGQLVKAYYRYKKALALNEKFGFLTDAAETYGHLAAVAQDDGRPSRAEAFYRKALKIYIDLGNQVSSAITYMQLSSLALDRGQVTRAIEWNVRCMTMLSSTDNPIAEIGLTALGLFASQVGLGAVEQAWQQVSGCPIPDEVLVLIADRASSEARIQHERSKRVRRTFRRHYR